MLASGSRGRRNSAAQLANLPAHCLDRRESVSGMLVLQDNANITLPNGDVFTGRAMEGVPLSGQLVTSDGSVYKGSFLHTRFHGQGRMVYANGDVYEGCWMAGGIVGEGRFKVKENGAVYKGVFGIAKTEARQLRAIEMSRLKERGEGSDDHATGGSDSESDESADEDSEEDGGAGNKGPTHKGLESAVGLHPVPSWVAAQRPEESPFFAHARVLTGRGEVAYTDGRLFRGPFRDGRPCGPKGELFIPRPSNSSRDTARFRSSVASVTRSMTTGSAVMRAVSAARRDGGQKENWFATYRGELASDGQPHGRGEVSYRDSDGKYTGEWLNGKPHGRGVEIATDGEYTGPMVRGVREGKGRLAQVCGAVYVGDFKAGTFHGRGELHDVEGGTFVGAFARGLQQGSGCLTSADGTRFIGRWEAGLREGLGVTLSASGKGSRRATSRTDSPARVVTFSSYRSRCFPPRTAGATQRRCCRAARAPSPRASPTLFLRMACARAATTMCAGARRARRCGRSFGRRTRLSTSRCASTGCGGCDGARGTSQARDRRAASSRRCASSAADALRSPWRPHRRQMYTSALCCRSWPTRRRRTAQIHRRTRRRPPPRECAFDSAQSAATWTSRRSIPSPCASARCARGRCSSGREKTQAPLR